MGVSLRGLAARFDGVALRPFEAPPFGTADWPALRAWCLSPAPWAVAVGEGADKAARAARVALRLDGTDRLLACEGSLQRLALKLRVKLDDVFASAIATPRTVWDTGWVPSEPAALTALARFEPRRATLIVIDGLQPAPVQQALQALADRQRRQHRPLRVLLLGAAAGAAAGAPRLSG